MVSRKHRVKPFLGNEIGKGDHRAIVSLIAHTSLTIGLAKRRLRNEEQLWRVTDAMFGMRRMEGEGFIEAVKRIRSAIIKIPEDERRALRQAGAAKGSGSV